MARAKRLASIGAECVACGTCVRICPAGALSVPNGIRAAVDPEGCVGCGKCVRACPAGVIAMLPDAEEAHA